MAVFEGLPDDERFRFIKWVDRFKVPHAGTRSASVEALFEMLPIQSITELNELDEATVRAIVGTRSGASAQSTSAEHTRHQFLTGSLPHLRIGSVYRGGRYVGQLPATQRHIDLPHESLLTKATIGANLSPPPGWGEGVPYRPMTAKQYELRPFRPFEQSECLYFLDRASSTEYVIPRAVIFRTFYASHTLLANAFTSGPWGETAPTLISEWDFRSGLKTQVDPVTGSWDVVLTPSVPVDGFVHLLALLWHEPYAKRCADNVYTAMLQSSERNADRVWFASAKIPYRPDDSALPLDVRGFDLLPRTSYFASGSEVPHHTFLVTSITSFPWPSWAPIVRWEKTNSGEKGKNQTRSPEPRPYGGGHRSRPIGSDVRLTSTADASRRLPRLEATEDRISITGAPPLEKMLKQNSIHYEGTSRPPPDEQEAPTASSGNSSYGVDAQQPIHHNTIARSKISNFTGLLDALEELPTGDPPLPVSYSVVQPEDAPMVALAAGEPCWDFLSLEERYSGEWPRFGWNVIREHKQRVPRAALILRISLQGEEGYWIEIEPRTANDAMCSPFLIGVAGDVQATLRSALAAIASHCGHHLQAPLEAVMANQGGGRVRCFRHRYTTHDHKAKWSAVALRAFLDGSFKASATGSSV